MKCLALLAVLGSLATAVCEGHACLSWDAGEPTVLQLAMFQRDLVGGGGFVESQVASPLSCHSFDVLCPVMRQFMLLPGRL